MSGRLRGIGLVSSLIAVTGCWDPAWPAVTADPSGGGADAAVPQGDYTWFQDVQPIVQRNCATCHGNPPRFSATSAMMSYTDMLAFHPTEARPIHELMAERVQATIGVMPPASQAPLTQAEIDTIVAWSAKGAPQGTPVEQFTWHQDVEPVIRDACHLCHGVTPQFSAPMSLVTYADVTRNAPSNQPYYDLMAFRIQAPTGRMPPVTHNRQLTPAEIAMITAWAESGAPEGEPPIEPRDGGVRDGGPPDSGPGIPWQDGTGSPPTGVASLEWADAWAHNGGSPDEPYAVPTGETLYTCWSFLVPEGTAGVTRYVTHMEPIIDTTSNTHHMMLFIDDSGANQNTAPVGPFPCDGFPFEATNNGTYAEYVDGWFPGRGLTPMPDGIGFPVENGDRLILQVHYDRVTGPHEDMSGIRLMLDDRQIYTPAGTLWNGVIWGTPLVGQDTRMGECTLTQDVTIFRSAPHMHQYGVRIVGDVRRAGSQTYEVLAEIPAWNVEDQPILDVPAERQLIRAGDTLRTRCWWDTGGETVRQGDASDDEMCFSIYFAYPPHPDTGPGGFCVTQ